MNNSMIAPIFCMSIGLRTPPNKPKWSIIAPMMICPAMMEAKVGATPILGMTNIEMMRYMTPKRPPNSCHFGTVDKTNKLPLPKNRTANNKANVPIANETNEASNTPIFLPNPPFDLTLDSDSYTANDG